MAHSYYSPRRVRRHSVSDLPDNNDDNRDGAANDHDLERSIFIFPSPSLTSRSGANESASVSGSADTSSPMSVPTDASFPTSFSPSSTSNTNINTNTVADMRGRGRATSNVSGFSEWTSFSGRSVSVDTRASPLVEVWEMSDDALEEEQPQQQSPRSATPLYTRQQFGRPLGTRPPRSQFVFSDGRFYLRAQAQARARGDSFVSSNTEKIHGHASIHESSRTAQTRLPLIALFSSLLNVEDGTLRLLTCPHPSRLHESPLFPGSGLQSAPAADANTEIDKLLDEKQRTTAQLSALALDKAEYASLKTGMNVVYERPGSESVFTFPQPLPIPKMRLIPFAYFVGLVKELCSYGMTVPQKIRLSAPVA